MRTLIRRPIAVLASMLASLAVLAAQSTSNPPPAQGQSQPQTQTQPQQPTFRARIDSVSVDVIVTDRQGNPVTDLKPEDFEVRESGKPQKVETFKFITVEDRDLDPSSFRQILSMSEQQRETASDLNRIFVILLDDYHVRRGNAMRIRQQLAAFVSNLTPRDLVAVLYPLTPINATTFSRFHDGTAQAIMSFEGRKYDYTPRNAYEERYQNMPPQTQEQMRNDLVISALQGACTYLGTLREGRKTLLYVSEGMTGTLPPGVNTSGSMFGRGATTATPENVQFFNSADLLMRMRDVFTAATRANTAIYTLDPRGLASEEFDIADRVDPQTSRRMFTEATDLLRVISDQTDGRAIVGRNDPFPELVKMVRDSSAYYLLGYTSTVGARDGKFHEIQVRVKRPNVEVRARKGYWAMSAEDVERASAPPKPGPARDVADALENLAAVVEPTSRKPVTVWMGATRGATEKAAFTLAWETTASAATDPSEAADHINITAQTIGGEMLFKGVVPRDPQLAIAGGKVTFDAPAGPIRVRVISEGVKNNRLDSEDVSYEVPDFTTPGPIVTTPVLFRARTARDVQVLKTAASPVPTAKRAFSRTERIYFKFDAYGPAGTTPTIAMRLLNNRGDSMAALPPATVKEGNTFEADFSLGALPPGDYLIEIAATSGSDTSRTLLALRITG